jgi:hypothetical protein
MGNSLSGALIHAHSLLEKRASLVMESLRSLYTTETFLLRLLGVAGYTERLGVVFRIRPTLGQGNHVITDAGFGVAAILETHDTERLLLE